MNKIFGIFLISASLFACEISTIREKPKYQEKDLGFYKASDKDYTASTWIRKSENIEIAHETFKKIGYKNLADKYGWCWPLQGVFRPCNELIDSLILTFQTDTINSVYYKEFWERRRKEDNHEMVYKVLKEIDSIQDGISVTPKLKKVNDTIYKMVQIISFSDSINQSEANENFKFLVRTGLHESAYNLLYERYEYYDIDWNQEELTTVLKSDSSRGNVWPIIEDDTK